MILPSRPPRPSPPAPPPEPSSHTDLHLAAEAAFPSIAPHSCCHCLPIVLDLAPLLADPTSTSIVRLSNLTQEHVIAAANEGCRFLATLTPEAVWSNPDARLAVGSPSVTYDLWLSLKPETDIVEIKIVPSNSHHGGGPYYDLYRLPGSDPPANDAAISLTHPELPPNLAPTSDLSFARLQVFLQAYIDTHTECRAFTTGDGDPFIPARLLELSGLSHAPSVRLRSSSSLMPMSPSSASPPPSYAILSYCWGGDQPSKLLSSRLVAYHRSIDRDTLPAAVLDACHVAARLGFNYLWVDALCIIQDDPHDKMLQIGQMHRIFRGAALTIAAETSPSATQGFLHPRADHQPSLIRISAGSDHHENTVVLVPRAYYPSRTETLHTRGWTFQETHLSARIVAYGAREPVFHCIASRLADGGAAPTLQDTASLSSIASLLDPGSAIMLGSPGSRPQHPYDWIAIINAYRARHLTVDEDRLPGIAALAEEYATRAGLQGLTDYLAGMWRTDLLAQCLWACDNGLDGPMQRLPEYIAPSWSWASMPPLKSPWYSGPEDIDQWTWSTVLDAHTTLCQPQDTPYAAVSDGLLRVRARRRRALRWYLGEANDYVGVSICFRGSDGRWDSDVFMGNNVDEWEDYRRPNPLGNKGGVVVWLVELCHRTTGEWDDSRIVTHGLILEEVKNGTGSVYHRNGTFEDTSFPGDSPFDHPDAELCDLTIA